MNNWRNILLLFVPGTIWGISFLLTEIALETIPPLTITAGRSILAVFLFGAVLYGRGGRLPPLGPAWIPYLWLGILSDALPYVMSTWGQLYIDSGLATVLISINPIFTITLAHFFTTDERLTGQKIVGVVLGLLGIFVLIGPDALQGLGFNIWAQLAVVASALSYSIGTIYMRNLLRRQDNQHLIDRLPQTLTGQLTCATVFIVPLALIFEQPWTLQPSVASSSALFAMVIFGSGVALAVYYYLLDLAGATFVSIVVYLIPINGVLWGALLLDEPITWQVVVAFILILGGVAVVNGGFGLRRPAIARS